MSGATSEAINDCTLGEAMVAALARTIDDGTLVFHGFGSPLVQLAMHVAKRTHAPHMVLVAGATYAVDPRPPFLSPTSNDWVLDRGAEATLDIEELFDLAASGRMGRMFLSGVQIDRWGSANVTRLGEGAAMKKLPGGGGGGNLSCDVGNVTLWTAAHRTREDRQGRRLFRLVERCDFVTNVGHRTVDGRTRAELGYRGGGPDWLVTDLGLFDFGAAGGMRLRGLYPDTTVEDVVANTGFAPLMIGHLAPIELPDAEVVGIIRTLDPMRVHERELRPEDRDRRFSLRATATAGSAAVGAGAARRIG